MHLTSYILKTALLLAAAASAEIAQAAVSIYGNAPSYAGKTLSLRTYSDQIMMDEEELGQAEVQSNGDFKFELVSAETQQVFIPLPTSRGFIYIEPDGNYEITLPEYSERTIQQKLSPFFAPKDFLLGIKNMDRGDLNFQMMEFDDGFDFYSMKHITYGSQPDSLKKSIGQMRSIFSDLKKPFQIRFKEYRYILLENMGATTTQLQDTVIMHLNKMGADTYNPAFWDALNNIFSDFVQRSRDTEDFEILKRIINVCDAHMLMEMLKERYKITDTTLRNLAAIKILADLANNTEFDKQKTIALQIAMRTQISDTEDRNILEACIQRSCLGYIGTPAVDFDCTTPSGKTIRLSELQGKYVYLNFGNSNLEKTTRDIQVLQRFADSFKNQLVVLNIFLYDTAEQVKKIESQNKGKMMFATVKNSDLIKQYYGIKAVPDYAILDKEGKYLMTKGSEPNDELRLFLQNMLK